MNQEQLNAIKERVAKATLGPWKVVKSEETGVQIGTTWESGQLKNCVPVVTTAHGVEFVTIYINDNNSNFIAHAREDVPALVAEVERLRKALQTIAEHNIFTTPQIDIKDFASQALDGEAHE
ncbi:hypothetical protein NXZ77_21435 [Lysinibacillus boronitolerans]|uniref:hypothetical protein n=1 Tax=Lysinibacillus boronitolerans TaxID=309788 RepID=UPI0021620E29|nr:hypothetical protein [Lysinibacillus boronitolerans]MCS1394140.1 hypothetical protein [Lysinibacillus boronitolerans]